MKRATFLAATAALAMPTSTSARTLDITDLLARIPGVTGVYARTLAPGSPLLAVHDGEPFASASIIKLWIMVTAYRLIDAKQISLRDQITVRADDVIGGSPFLGIHSGRQKFSLDELLRAMIRLSDNTASNTLITQFGFAAINRVIAECGMTGTKLARHFADVVPSWRRNLNQTTPRDCGLLLYAIERGAREGIDTIAKSRTCRAMIDLMLAQEDRSKIPAGLPHRTPVANKTGEIDGVRNDAAIVDPYGDSPYILVVLTRDLTDVGAGDPGIAAIARRVNARLHS